MTPLLLQGTAQRLGITDGSISTIITSPPYFGLRLYTALPPEAWRGGAFMAVHGVAPIVIPGPETWAELDACEHVWDTSPTKTAHTTNGTSTSTLQGAHSLWSAALAETDLRPSTGAWCQRCGCWCGTLGSEPTVELYLWHMVLVLREMHRALRNDGTLYLNLGDSYDNGNLLGIPWRVAFAAQADTFKEDAPEDEDFAFPGGQIGAAWLAALVDGEGTIGIAQAQRNTRWNPNYSNYLSIGMTDRNVLEHVQEVVGHGAIVIKAEPGDTDARGIVNRRRYFSYRIEGQKAAAVLRYIYPYLIAKKKQAILGHNLALLLRWGKAGRYEGKVPEENMEKRAWCFHATKRLNQRQPLDMPSWLIDMPCVVNTPRWILRRDVIWEKVSPMPESVAGTRWEHERCPCVTARKAPPTQASAQQNAHASHDHSRDIRNKLDGYGQPASDCPTCHGTGRLDTVTLRRGSWRHTASHEYVFQLVKQMGYWANAEAVREENEDTQGRMPGDARYPGKKHLNRAHSKIIGWSQEVIAGRNPRDVIRPAPSAFSGAHFAVFPPSLPEQFLRASCPERVCTACGEPWAVVVNSAYVLGRGGQIGKKANSDNGWTGFPNLHRVSATHGLARTCSCPTDTPSRPGICLDPFSGTGTVGLVARALGRDSIGVEASPVYLKLARERLSLAALDAWEGKPVPARAETYTDLPLFT